MADTTTRPGALIATIFGQFVRRLGGWIPVADLVELLAELGVDAPAARSAISRLKKTGELAQERRGAVGYRIAEAFEPVFAEGDRRIFASLEPARLEDGWVVAVFSVPESERARRHQLRTRLSWLGFGNASPGVWLAPARLLPDVSGMLRREGLDPYVHLFTSAYAGFAELRSAVGQWWDLPALEAQYTVFTEEYTPLISELARGSRLDRFDEVEAFRRYVPMLNAWRRLPYLDPGLPTELLPADWNAVEARRIFAELHGLLAEPSMRHVMKLTGLSLKG